ncbi:MAG TPA: RsmG family class I SAM-dependent methyltransferase [Candidatus Deferrimicrobium sp.]|nr:RsmG family class I SAM-dependent methyltransferase [Candidatus Deferrimicrobium sp.]
MAHSAPPIVYDPAELLRRCDPENRLERYFHLLLEENQRVNLVSRETAVADSFGLKRLAAESLLPLEQLTDLKIDSYLDIGSGGGFPAIPILLTRQVNYACFIERTKKKAAALKRILVGLNLPATVIDSTFEEYATDTMFDLITARQVKLTPALLKRILSMLRRTGCLVYFGEPTFTLSTSRMTGITYCYSSDNKVSTGKFTLFRKQS